MPLKSMYFIFEEICMFFTTIIKTNLHLSGKLMNSMLVGCLSFLAYQREIHFYNNNQFYFSLA